MGLGSEAMDEVLSDWATEVVLSIGSVGIDAGMAATGGCVTGSGLRGCV